VLYRTEIIENPGTATMRANYEVVVLLLDLDVTHRYSGHIQPHVHPRITAVPREVDAAVHTYIKQVRVGRVLADHLGVVVLR